MTYLLRLAYRNFLRNRRRSIISGISIAMAIAFIIFFRSYMEGVTNNISDNIVKLISGHVRITTKEYERRERLLPLSEAIDLTPQFYEMLDNEEVMLVSPRIKFGVMLGEEELNVPALGYAVDAKKEEDISGLHRRIVEGHYIESGERAAILGTGLTRRLNVEIGDTLTVITRTAYDSPAGVNLLVKGVFSTGIGGMDRSIFYVPLDVGQKLLDLEGRATEVALILKNRDLAIDVARDIGSVGNLSVVPFQQNPLLQYLTAFSVVQSMVFFIILLVACSTIANTMIMVIFERTKEIGMMKAMGMNNVSLIGLLVIEAGLIGVIGSLMGAVGGSALSYWLKYRGFDLSLVTSHSSADMPFGPIIYFSPTPLVIIGTFLFGLLASIIVTLFLMRGVAKIDPAKALKTI